MKNSRERPVTVVIKDLENHPHCQHGPTLLFSSDDTQFYSCAAFRDKKDCNFYKLAINWTDNSIPNKGTLTLINEEKVGISRKKVFQ
jgi:hypothetical protein